jgi:DNA replication protein DnaC
MERLYSGTVETPKSVSDTLSAVIKRIESAMEENRLAVENIKTCPGPCIDRTVTVAFKSGKTRRLSCPIANPNCAYGRRLKDELNDYLSRLLSEIGIPRRHVESLANYRESISVKTALEWTYRGFLLLCGRSGTGKSFTAVCLLRKYLKNKIRDRMDKYTWKDAEYSATSVAWINAAELSIDREAIGMTKSVRLLVLDDFGDDGGAKANHSAMNRVISARYDAMLPTIITTELAIENIKTRYGRRAVEKIVAKSQDGGMIIVCG